MNKEIAIIGMSGRFPSAENIDQFYKNLKEGKDCVKDISESRKRDCYLPDQNYQVLGFLEDINKFDHDFFGISNGEAEQMDPQQRMILEVTHELIENSGYSIDDLNNTKTGFFLSCPPSNYENYIEKSNATSRVGNLNSIIPGRVARYFNLKGNSSLVDTTCSSSLVGVYMACQQIYLGEADQMIVCGANLILFPPIKNHERDLEIVSSSGKAKSFSDEADGTGIGEAVASVMLKPLEKAIADNDNIHAVIIGGAINQDANRSSFLTAPSKVAQTDVIIEAWKKSKVNPETIKYVEAHGTGTILGDPIEFDGINSAFKEYTNKESFCALSSVKSNIGHTNHAAGICGLIKAVLSLKHQELFPSLHISAPNKLISLNQSAVYLNNQLKGWSAEVDDRLRAGVSAFGVSGTNCHLVVEEAPEDSSTSEKEHADAYSEILCWSAKSKESLSNYLKVFTQKLEDNLYDIASLSHTLNHCRSHYDYRHSILARDIEEVKSKLADFTADKLDTVAKEPKLIFLFSDNTLFHSDFIEKHPYADKINKHYDDKLSTNEKAVLIQYALFCDLIEKGLSSNYLFGLGVGEIAISIALEEISIEEGLKRARDFAPEEDTNLNERVSNYVEAEMKENNILFIEIGAESSITNLLSQHELFTHNMNLVPMSNDMEDDIIQNYIKEAYLAGYSIDWKAFYKGKKEKKVEIPSYQFDKVPCWIKNDHFLNTSRKSKDNFYTLKWIEEDLSNDVLNLAPQQYLIIADSKGLYKKIIEYLENNAHQYVLIFLSDDFEKISLNEYKINQHSFDDYFKLGKHLQQQNKHISGVLNLSAFGLPNDNECMAQNFDRSIYTAFLLTKALNHLLLKKNFAFLAVTSNAHKVLDKEKVNLTSSSLTAFYKALLSEYPSLKVQTIDLSENDSFDNISNDVFGEIQRDELIKFVAYRNGQRYIQNLQKKELEIAYGKDDFNRYQSFILTGGASGIGYQIAQSMAKINKGTLIILGRTALPARPGWESYLEANLSNDIAHKIKNLMSLEKLGSQVAYYSIDLERKEETLALADNIRKKHGEIQGVLHSAGVKGAASPISKQDIESFKATLGPKVSGTLNVLELCNVLNVKKLIINSSLNTIIPQKNSVDYTVANAFVDALALDNFSEEFKCIAINWPGWRETGMSIEKGSAIDSHTALYTLSNEEGVRAFHIADCMNIPNLVVAASDFKKVMINPFLKLSELEEHNNKLDVKTERDWEIDIENIEHVQLIITEIWSDVLKTNSIKPDDDFFDLGGHSLNGGQIINRIEKELNVEVEFENLLDYSTMEALAQFVHEKLNEGPQSGISEKIEPIPAQEYYDVSHGQRRIWILSQMDATQFAFNMPGAYFYEGPFDFESFSKAMLHIAKRHEILRTTFSVVNDEIKQRVTPIDDYNLEADYLDFSDKENAKELAHEILSDDVKAPFDLENGSLLRTKVVKLRENEHIIMLSMHHIVSDGWSMEIFIEELLKLYISFYSGEQESLPPLGIQYKDYAAWQNQQLSGDSSNEHEHYWLSRFQENVPVSNFPTDFTRPASRTYGGGNAIILLDQVSLKALYSLSKEHSSSLFMTLVAVVKAFIFLKTNEQDIVIGTPISGRTHKDLENQIGLYLNTLALRTDFNEKMTFAGLLSDVRKTCLEAFEHQVYPFDLLIEKLGNKTDPSRSPLFDFMVMLQKNYRETGEVANDALSPKLKSFDVEIPQSKYDLTFNFNESSDNLYVNIEYNSSIFKETTVNLMGLQLNTLLKQIIDNQHKSLSDYSIALDFEARVPTSLLDIDFDF